MENLDKNFEKEWKEAFDEAEETPPSAIWQNLDSHLAYQEISFYRRKYFYTRAAAAALLLLLLSSFAYFLLNQGAIGNGETSANRDVPASNEHLKRTDANGTGLSGQNPENKIAGSIADSVNRSATNKINYSEARKDEIALKQSSGAQSSQKKSTRLSQLEATTDNIPERDDLNPSSPPSSNPIASWKNRKENLNSDRGNSENVKTDDNNKVVLSSESNGHSYESKEQRKKDELNLVHDESRRENLASTISLSSSYLKSKGADISDSKEKQMLLLFAQNTTKPSANDTSKDAVNKRDRWYSSIDFTPTYTNQNFERAQAYAPATSLALDPAGNKFALADARGAVHQLDLLVKPDFSFTSGFNAGFKINDRLRLESGAKYSYVQSKVTTNLFVSNTQNSTSSVAFNEVLKNNSITLSDYTFNDESVSNEHQSPSLINTYKTVKIYTQYTSIPLTLHYLLIDKRINLIFGAGFSTDLFLQYGSKKDKDNSFEKEKIQYYENSVFKKVGFSLMFNPEIEYELFPRYSLYVRPVFRAALGSYTQKDKIINKPNSTGVGFGIRYNFGK